MAQVMYYWKYPTQAPALPAYTTTTRRISMPALPGATLDWNNMIDDYTGSYTTAQGNAVATLMLYCGQSCYMDYDTYSAGGSGAYTDDQLTGMKAFGYNTIRCSHNPYSESFTKIADRVGMLVVDELTDKWGGYWGGRQPFTALWPSLIKEWVTRDRNSPSVILWSLGNELQTREDWTGYAGLNDWGVTMYRVMNPVVKRFDPTRLTTVAMFPARAGAIGHREKDYKDYTVPPELSQVTDVASLN